MNRILWDILSVLYVLTAIIGIFAFVGVGLQLEKFGQFDFIRGLGLALLLCVIFVAAILLYKGN